MSEIDNAREVIASLKLTAQQIGANQYRMLYRMGTLVRDTAREYAPISPDMGTLKAWRHAQEGAGKKPRTPAQEAADKGRRKANATSRAKPGGLERAVSMKATKDDAEIFVATNSEAGKYAWRIHEEKGKAWKHRGPGTVLKGAKADDKFIWRAMVDNEAKLETIARDQVEKAIEQANRGT